MEDVKKPKSLSDFAIPVRRSIIRRDLWIGLPLIPLVLLVFGTILICLVFSQFAFIVISVIFWFILKKMTDNDEWFLDILLKYIFQPDKLR
jgi:type IV secretory pathway VirB3-like protein